MSVTTGGSVSQLCHAGEAKFQVRGGQSTYGRNKGSVTAISEITTSQILTSRILGLTLTLSPNNIASSAVPRGQFSAMLGNSSNKNDSLDETFAIISKLVIHVTSLGDQTYEADKNEALRSYAIPSNAIKV